MRIVSYAGATPAALSSTRRRRNAVWWTGVSLAMVTLAGGLSTPAASAAPAYVGNQWGLSIINASPAFGYAEGASGVPIGIVDTGVDPSQQDLSGQVVAATTILSSPTNGCNTAQNDPNGVDDNGHGTHVAGIASASGRSGVEGVDPGARLVVAKVLDCSGSGTDADVAAGIDWVVAHGARVINLSLGSGAFLGLVNINGAVSGTATGQALNAAFAHGAIPVVAGGNDSGGAFGFADPDYSGVDAVIVAATGSPNSSPSEAGTLASYSNPVTNATWGIAAPGGDDTNGPTTPVCGPPFDPEEILSTFWTSGNALSCYATDEGTSMATPFVTGTLALLLSRGLSPAAAINTLLSTANHGVSCGSRCSGLLNAGAALASTGPPPSAPAHGVAPTTTRPAPVAHSTPASSTTSSSSTSSSAPTTSTVAPRVRAAGATRGGGSGSSGHGSIWWLVLPIVLGAALLGGLAWYATRDGSRELAMVQLPTDDGGAVTVPPADPPPHTGGDI